VQQEREATNMTNREALKKAKQLFGSKAALQHRRAWTDKKGKTFPESFTVGTIEGPDFFPVFFVEGCGSSWEAAFADVENKKQEALQRKAEAETKKMIGY
jgi:hypothetical protein